MQQEQTILGHPFGLSAAARSRRRPADRSDRQAQITSTAVAVYSAEPTPETPMAVFYRKRHGFQ
ncbi:MAG: hypothetical protein D6741_01010 [Planctomycetota bacterium]|nr:MAG: hypothetical protein D6741_01010 [Planctomycetota bacterium]